MSVLPPWGEEHSDVFPLAAAGAGAVLGYRAAFPPDLLDLPAHPRLARLQKTGSKHGLRILSKQLAPTISPIPPEAGLREWFAGLTERAQFSSHIESLSNLGKKKYEKYRGLVYNYDILLDPTAPEAGYLAETYKKVVPPRATLLNFGAWEVGTEKWQTHRYLQEKGLGHLLPRTIGMEQFLSDQAIRREFLSATGGTSNLVVKHIQGATGRGVWLDWDKISKPSWDQIREIPPDYIVQEKMALRGEYRVVTAGGRAIYTAHRFGSPGLQRVMDYVRRVSPSLADEVARRHLTENIQPVLGGMKPRLAAFAERIAGELPIDITAFDIAHTASNELKLIEVQRTFGTFSNPVVNRRIISALTGRPSRALGITGAAFGALAGLGLYKLVFGRDNDARANATRIPGSDDAYNTIEGLRHGGMAEQKRRQMTHFGSGMRKIFGSIERFMQTPSSEVMPTLHRWLSKAGMSVVDPPGGVIAAGGIVRKVVSEESWPALVKQLGLTGREQGALLWNRQRVLLEDLSSYLFPDQIKPSTIESYFGHEVSELFHGTTYPHLLQRPVFGTHYSPSVIVDEALLSMKLGGREGFQSMKQFRMGERATYEARAESLRKQLASLQTAPPRRWPGHSTAFLTEKAQIQKELAQAENYISRVEKIYATMEKNWLPRFESALQPRPPGQIPLRKRMRGFISEQLYNLRAHVGEKIEGFRHTGQAGKLRPKNTDMGSGYQGTKRPVVSEYIAKLHAAGEPGSKYLFPESLFVHTVLPAGSRAEVVAADLAWHNFLTAHYSASTEKFTRSPLQPTTPPSIGHSPIKRGWLKWLSIVGGSIFALHLISGKDDDYNTIEGLPELGLASKQRKILTDFGSGYDAARGIAREMGISFEKLLGLGEFKQALMRGTIERELGSGAFGIVQQMKTTFRGQEFRFARKIARPETTRHARLIEEELGGVRQMFEREASAMSKLAHTEVVPSAYMTTNEALFMELMPGQSLYGSGKILRAEAASKLRKATKEAAQMGIWHTDIAARNVLVDPKTGRVALVDFGSVAFHSPEQTAEALGDMHQKIRRIQEWHQNIADLAPVTGSMTKVAKKMKPRKIPGFQGGDMASSKREAISDFKDKCWKGLFGGVSKKITRYMAKIAKPGVGKLLDPRRAAKLAEGQTLEEFARSLYKQTGVKAGIAKSLEEEQIIMQRFGGPAVGGSVPGAGKGVLLAPQALREQTVERAMQAGMSREAATSAVMHDDFLKTVMYHETLEAQTRFGFQAIKPMKDAGHLSSQVLIGEGGFVAATKNQHVKELFRVLRKGQKTERAAFSAGLEAFQETGAAPELRKLITDFGSKYRGLLGSVSKKLGDVQISRSQMRQKMTRASSELKLAQQQMWESASRGGKNHTRRNSSGFVRHLTHYGVSAT